MPHVVIEYSQNVDTLSSKILQAAYNSVKDSGLFDIQAIKGRSICYTHYMLPDGARNFIHITVSILEGRSEEECAALSKQIFNAVKHLSTDIDRLSVDINEMTKATYTK